MDGSEATAVRRSREDVIDVNRHAAVLVDDESDLATSERLVREQRIGRVRLLWDQRRTVARVAIVGFLLASVIAFLIPKQFVSTTQLMPPDQGSSGGSMALMTALSGKIGDNLMGLLPGMKTTADLFVGILRSRTVQDDLIRKFNLQETYSIKGLDDTRKKLASRTSITDDKKSGIITIEVSDRDPRLASALAAEYVVALNRVVVDSNTTSAHRERVFLEGRLAEVGQSLEEAERNFSEFSSKNSMIDLQAQGRAVVETAARLEGQFVAAQTELQGLREIYTDSNTRVRATQARVDELRRQLQKLGGTKDALPAENSGTPYPSIRKLPLLGVTFEDLYRNAKIQETIFETLTRQNELAKVEEAKEVPSVRVLDPAEVPENKSFPPRFLIIFLGTVFCASLGVIFVLGKASWQETDEGDPAKVLAQEVFDTVREKIPSWSKNGSRSLEVGGKGSHVSPENGSAGLNEK